MLVELKHGRRRAIYLQREAYNQLLRIVAGRQRKIDKDEHAVIGVSPEEIKFMNMLRVLLDAGWCLDETSLVQVIKLSGVQQTLDEYKEKFEVS